MAEQVTLWQSEDGSVWDNEYDATMHDYYLEFKKNFKNDIILLSFTNVGSLKYFLHNNEGWIRKMMNWL